MCIRDSVYVCALLCTDTLPPPGATITTLSQIIGSEISSFGLNCNGSETKIEDCLEEYLDSITSQCRRVVTSCFLTDPDPHLCNVPFLTTSPKESPEDQSTVSDIDSRTEPSKTTTWPLPPTDSLKFTTAKISQKGSSNITTVTVIGMLIIAILMVGAAGIVVIFIIVCLRRRKNERQQRQNKNSKQQQQMEIQTNENNECAEITVCVPVDQREDTEDVYQYTKNDAYDSRPRRINRSTQSHNHSATPPCRLCYVNVRSGQSAMVNDQQGNKEPVYETIPVLISCNSNNMVNRRWTIV